MIYPNRSNAIALFWTLLFLAGQVGAQDNTLFPRPPELEPAVRFWVKVYTEVDTRSGFLHDSQDLSVIYERLPLDQGLIEATRKRIQDDLKVLASGKRSGLTANQQKILDLWPPGVGDRTLGEAASNVRWQLGQSDRFLAGLVRSGAYRAHINQVIREKNLPIELGVLPHVESSFNPQAYSSASAAGMWQFGRATGQRFMQIDHIVDERMDPYTATYAAMSLLEYNYSILGTWPLALTAYNHGAGGMARAKRELGTDRIEQIIARYKGRAFGFASRNFYPQFLAVLEVENNARRFFGDIRLDPAPDFTEVVADAFIEADVFARSVGVTREQLREDNPALRPIVWEGTKRIPKGYPIKVRGSRSADAGTLLAMIPAGEKFAAQTPDVEYVVERGDSLSAIASRFDTSVDQLVSLNQLASRHRIQIGQRLLLPHDGAEAQRLLASTSASLPRPDDGVYQVRAGDTISLIAARFDVGEADLLRANRITDPHRIYPGQQLALPAAGENAMQDPPVDAAPLSQPALREVAEAPVTALVADGTSATPSAPVGPTAAVGSGSIDAEPLAPVAGILPPAAVLPDNQELVELREPGQGEALAVEPSASTEDVNEQLVNALLADPSDYSVAADNSIEIQASETLGHYADWLGIQSRDLRRLNNMGYQAPVITGERLMLDFSRVAAREFEIKRRDFHLRQQQEFFSRFRIQDVTRYQVAANDNLGSIARRRFATPIWLLRQYNPDLDFDRVQIGQEVIFPLLESAE